MEINFDFNGIDLILKIFFSEDKKMRSMYVLDVDRRPIDTKDLPLDKSLTLLPIIEEADLDLLRASKILRESFFPWTAKEAATKYLAGSPGNPSAGASVLSAASRAVGRPDLAISLTDSYTHLDNTAALFVSRGAAMIDLGVLEGLDSSWFPKAKRELGRAYAQQKSSACKNVYNRLEKCRPELFSWNLHEEEVTSEVISETKSTEEPDETSSLVADAIVSRNVAKLRRDYEAIRSSTPMYRWVDPL